MGERESLTPRESVRGAFVGKSDTSLWHSAGGLVLPATAAGY